MNDPGERAGEILSADGLLAARQVDVGAGDRARVVARREHQGNAACQQHFHDGPD